MSTKKFIILITIIINLCGGILLHRYLKEQENARYSQERRIDRLYEVLGLE